MAAIVKVLLSALPVQELRQTRHTGGLRPSQFAVTRRVRCSPRVACRHPAVKGE